VNDNDVLIRNDPLYSGLPIIDFQERLDSMTGTFADLTYWLLFTSTKFYGLHFRNMAPGRCVMRGSNPDWWVIHCVFYSQNGSPTGFGIGSNNFTNDMNVNIRNCTAQNLEKLCNCQGPGSLIYNNYAPDSTAFNTDTGATEDHNAYAGNTEPNGIDSGVTDPGFKSVGTLDFRLDETAVAAYQTYMTSGLDGDRISAMARGGTYYSAAIPQFRFLTPDPSSNNPNLAWENEGPNGTNTYTEGNPGDIIEDGATSQIKIDLAANDTATGGRIRSDVFDVGTAGTPTFVQAAFAAFEDGASGALIDTETTLPQKFEYRSSGTVFLKGDVSPAWIEIEQQDSFNVMDRYIQFRVEFRTDHTNA
jgi:hypothetical protein